MSLDVAIQSVVFYILSCSTCSKISHRRKAKIQAKKDRAAKEHLETEQPGLYRHPSPFSTNPYWTEEIVMGPEPKKAGDKSHSKNTSQQALHIGRQGSSCAGSTTVGTEPSNSPTVVTEGSRISGEGWNTKRYQREDEALWGIDFQGPGQRLMDAIAKAGSSASRMIESRLGKGAEEIGEEEQRPGMYFMARNPPVNDLHPPIVSTQPTSRDETRWMLQPPPSAKIMEGKERVVARSRASSNTSSRKGTDEPPLSRQLTGKLVDAKLQRGELPYLDGPTTPSRPAKAARSGRPKGQQHDRHRSSSTDSISSDERVIRRKRKPPPVSISTHGSSSRDTIEHIPPPSSQSSIIPPRSAGSERKDSGKRPVLSTIMSSSKELPPAAKIQQPLGELDGTDHALNSRISSPSHRLSPKTAPGASSKTIDDMTPSNAPILSENSQPPLIAT